MLVLNSGSSSLKYAVSNRIRARQVADGIVEQIGEPSTVADHAAALRVAFDKLADDGIDLKACGLVAVGHRVVHGGPDLYRPTVVDDAVIAELEELSLLAPLHNPPAVLGIEVARKAAARGAARRGVRHRVLPRPPAAAATYAIDRELAEKWHIRRYGFHGTSHRYVSEQAAEFLEAAGSAESDRAASG